MTCCPLGSEWQGGSCRHCKVESSSSTGVRKGDALITQGSSRKRVFPCRARQAGYKSQVHVAGGEHQHTARLSWRGSAWGLAGA